MEGMGAGALVTELSAGGERQRDPEVKHGTSGAGDLGLSPGSTT